MSGRWIALVAVGLACLQALARADGPAAAPPPGTYVVKSGDTLWSIARDVLKNPALWRSLAEQNPFITDPNRIYPGDTLVVPGARPTAPPIAETPSAPPAPEVKAEAEAPKPATPPPAEAQAAPPAPPAPAPVMVTPPVPPVPPASPHALACSPALNPEIRSDEVGVGSLVKHEDDRLMLSMEDDVFLGLDGGAQAKVGDRLAVVRLGDRIAHPVTRTSVGRVLDTLGVVEVREVRDRTLKGRIIYSCMAMQVGDRVVPFAVAALPPRPAAVPAARAVEGVIVSSPRSLQILGLQHLVFLDVGADQGIRQGDVFAIYRPNLPAVNPSGGPAFAIPPDRLGEAVVLRVTGGTATAVLTALKKDSRPGDRVVLSRQMQP